MLVFILVGIDSTWTVTLSFMGMKEHITGNPVMKQHLHSKQETFHFFLAPIEDL